MNCRSIVLALAFAAAIVMTAGPTRAQGAMEGIPLSKELAYATYVEQAGRVEVIVGTYLAALEEAEAYIPFRVAVGVSGKGPELRVTIENFQLHDSDGAVYESATPEEVAKIDLNQLVHQWNKTEPLNTGNHFATSHIVATEFYPLTGVATNEAYLDRETHLEDIVYFPRPKAGLDGEMMLSFFAKGMEAGPVNVRFKTPPLKKKHKKKAEQLRESAD